jgi:hypothetical protein
MDIHENARLTPRGRAHIVRLVQNGQTPKAAAHAIGVSARGRRGSGPIDITVKA